MTDAGKQKKESEVSGRHPNSQQVYEKVLNFTNHQGNQIKTTVRYHLTLVHGLDYMWKLKKKVRLIVTEGRMVIAREMGKCWSKGTNFQL